VTLQIQRWGQKALSLRQMRDDLAEDLGTSVGLRTINERLQTPLMRQPGTMDLSTVPPVVLLDGIWVTLLVPTGMYREDSCGRRRPIKKKSKVVILIALGVWPQSGTIRVLDWEITSGERCEDWELLLSRLYARRLRKPRGLRLFVHDGGAGLKAALKTCYWDVPSQRCVFHKLRNVWDAVVLPEDRPGRESHQMRRLLIRQAAAVFRAPDELTARCLMADFADRWEAEQPQAVATLLRDQEDTLRFYDMLESNLHWKPEALRTTSLLERLNRKLRRVFRAAGAYHSLAGLEAAVLRVLAPLVIV
jgi:transposase-like protein